MSETVEVGCGHSLAALFCCKPKHSRRHPYNTSSSSITTTATSSPPRHSTDIRRLRAVQGFGRLGGESMAVEKESDEPYMEFRRSMLEMIMEKELYSKDDLKHLLNCYLQLNSPYYHPLIVKAFAQIWNGAHCF